MSESAEQYTSPATTAPIGQNLTVNSSDEVLKRTLEWCRLNASMRIMLEKSPASDAVALYQHNVRCRTCTVLNLQCSREVAERRWRLQQTMGSNESDLQVKPDREKKLVSNGNASGSDIITSAGPNVHASNKPHNSKTGIIRNPLPSSSSSKILSRSDPGPDPNSWPQSMQLITQAPGLLSLFREKYTEIQKQLQICQARNNELVKENQKKGIKLASLEAELAFTRDISETHIGLTGAGNISKQRSYESSKDGQAKRQIISLEGQSADQTASSKTSSPESMEDAPASSQSLVLKHTQTIRESDAQYDTRLEDLVRQKGGLETKLSSLQTQYDETIKCMKLLKDSHADALFEKEKSLSACEKSLVRAREDNRLLSERLREYRLEETTTLQNNLIEHANIQVLVRLLHIARADFAANQLTKEDMLQTCDNLCAQLSGIAERRLERVPMGFEAIRGVMLGKSRSQKRTRPQSWEQVIMKNDEADEESLSKRRKLGSE
ncbi:hypothetical protein F5876DRAFT_77253 [Lentinula aff. lateritia]|uniref:Uncharacterized protein n=1 Tax=Lentinula aff. lateritia TaxID=2804960 RepID=A0ACC1TZC9_9AGAR|nr:hypothetical protein F5876DRAFT_77253 [Lentinula aff. lateritia]